MILFMSITPNKPLNSKFGKYFQKLFCLDSLRSKAGLLNYLRVFCDLCVELNKEANANATITHMR